MTTVNPFRWGIFIFSLNMDFTRSNFLLSTNDEHEHLAISDVVDARSLTYSISVYEYAQVEDSRPCILRDRLKNVSMKGIKRMLSDTSFTRMTSRVSVIDVIRYTNVFDLIRQTSKIASELRRLKFSSQVNRELP